MQTLDVFRAGLPIELLLQLAHADEMDAQHMAASLVHRAAGSRRPSR